MVQTRSASSSLVLPTPPPTTPSRGSRAPAWVHVPRAATLVWLAVSLPLVIWDTGYVLLRPWSMPGGALHWPLWAPYALYGEVDHMYGFKQFDARNGFTGAQGLLNAIETLMYGVYLYVWWAYGKPTAAKYGGGKGISGRAGGFAVLVAFSAAVMTVSKTVLYCEYMPAEILPPVLACVAAWRGKIEDLDVVADPHGRAERVLLWVRQYRP